jgi:CBS domain-containing protein
MLDGNDDLPRRIEEVLRMDTTTSGRAGADELLGLVGEAMTAQVVLLAADTPAAMAVRRLERMWVSGAPVVERGRVVGVVTLRDLLTPLAASSGGSPFSRDDYQLAGLKVRDLMSSEPVTTQPDWPLVRAVRLMVQAGVNRVPVVNADGRPVGILTRDDVLRALARCLRDPPAETAPPAEAPASAAARSRMEAG